MRFHNLFVLNLQSGINELATSCEHLLGIRCNVFKQCTVNAKFIPPDIRQVMCNISETDYLRNGLSPKLPISETAYLRNGLS